MEAGSGISGVDGLISGIDTTAIIDSMIDAASGNIRVQESKRELAEQKLDLVQQFNVKLLNTQLDLVGLKRSSTFTGRTTSVGDSDILQVTSADDVAPGTYEFDVQQIARAQQLSTAGFASAEAAIGTGSISIQVGDGAAETVAVDAGSGTLQGLADAINAAGIGVSAQIINDGSAAPFRLVLNSTATGADQTLSFDASGLSGAGSENLQAAVGANGLAGKLSGYYRGSGLPDVIDIRVKNAGSGDADVATYEIRVGSSGSYIDLDEGHIDRSTPGRATVDLAAALGLDGSAGPLSVELSGSALTAGDSAVSLRPLQELRAAQDAMVRFGSDASSFTISRSSNSFTDLVPGLDVDLGVKTGVTSVTVGYDQEAITEQITTFVDSFNDAVDFLDEHTSFNPETREAGLLLSYSNLRSSLNELVRTVTDVVENDGEISLLTQIGIELDDAGKLSVDSSALADAISTSIDDVASFFTDGGNSSNSAIEFAALGDASTANAVDVTVTRAAEQARLVGSNALGASISVTDNATIDLDVNGSVVRLDLVNKPGGYSRSEFIAHLQSIADQQEELEGKQLHFALDDANRLTITGERYGAQQSILVRGGSAVSALGLSSGTRAQGTDVAATINGEQVTGVGQVLAVPDGSDLAGLTLISRLTADQVADGNDSATITLSEGLASRIDAAIGQATDAQVGSVTAIETSLANEMSQLEETIAKAELNLDQRRERLRAEFLNMETLLGQFQAQEQFIVGQLEAFANMSSSAAKR